MVDLQQATWPSHAYSNQETEKDFYCVFDFLDEDLECGRFLDELDQISWFPLFLDSGEPGCLGSKGAMAEPC